MTAPRIYAVGRSGHPTCLWSDHDRLLTLHEVLQPGSYWISECEPGLMNTPWALIPEADDWGTLTIGQDGTWCLRSLAGMEAGPGYVIV